MYNHELVYKVYKVYGQSGFGGLIAINNQIITISLLNFFFFLYNVLLVVALMA